MKILLVHWDKAMGRGLRQALQRMGYAVILASDDITLRQMLERRPDVILVDSGLLEIDGRQIFDQETTGTLPILMAIPSLSDDGTRSVASAEDQAACTQGHLRLVMRMLRRLRRLTGKDVGRIKVGGLIIYPGQKRVLFHGQLLRLTPLQFGLLNLLALQPGRVFSPGELLADVWGYEADDTAARELLKVHIRRLRHKMRAVSPDGSAYIQSIRGFGYCLAAPEAK